MHRTVLKWGLSLMLGFGVAGPASAAVVTLEQAVEAVALDLRLNPDSTGTVRGRSCARCALREFPVSAATKALHNNDRVDLRPQRSSGDGGERQVVRSPDMQVWWRLR